jgi:TPR repeat protein
MSQLALVCLSLSSRANSSLSFVSLALFYILLLFFCSHSYASDSKSTTDIETDQQTFNTLQTIAENGNATAQRMLASMYEQGDGVAKDMSKAITWYRKAAALNDDVAQFYLGYLYYQAMGLKKDYKQAFIWFSKAAQQGNADFQYNLGNLYRYGEGTEVDLKSAVKWYQLAANQDQSNAQFDLASLSADGMQINQDLIAAYVWYTLASAQIDTSAQLKTLVSKMTQAQLDTAQTKTQEWITKHRRSL